MTNKQSIRNRLTSVFLAVAILFTVIPLTAIVTSAASVVSNRTADLSTMDDWKDFFHTTGELSTENAGGVWMDKSVFTDSSAFAGLGISRDRQDSFLVALSAMAANMSITGMSHVPTDSMLVLDVSGSMNDGDNDVAEELVQAANASIKALLETNSYNRVGVVLYSGSSSSSTNYTNGAVVLLPLDRYTTGADGQYLNYTMVEEDDGWFSSTTTETISLDSELRIEGTNTRPTPVSKEVVGATYMQRGIITAMNQFLAEGNNVTVNNQKIKPVLVLMSDGAPSLGSTNFTDPGYNQNSGYNLGSGSGTSAALGFVTQLTAAYAKAKIEEKYGADALFYTLGLGLGSNDTVALSVMDPANPRGSTAVDDFWNDKQTNRWGQVTFEGYNLIDVGETVSLGNNRSVTKIATPLDQNYVDKYFAANGSSGNLAAELEQAFEDIVGTIQLQSGYYPTLISESEDLSGYVSFVDRIGQYMKVTDIKGILIHNHLFSGADLASNFVSGGGALGTYDNPSALGMEMVAAVRARLGLESDELAATLIALAYENGQLSYTDANNFSNYIGWYANAQGKFLGFYHEDSTVLPAPTGNEATDPAFIIRSYGYLGEVDESHGVSESDMMYATVQVRKNITTGEELVTFAVPAALIPTITYHVTLDEDGSLTDLAATGAENPIRLVYEVALDNNINSFNIKELVSAEYLADPHNVNADGTINFYTNQWDHENKADYGTVNTYGYFNPSRQNDRYYYLEDAPVYTDRNGTLYTGLEKPNANGTFYRSYKVYKNNGSLRTETVYRELSDEAKETAVPKNDGSWYIPKGNVHVNLDGYTVHKEENRTGTLTEASVPFVDTANHSVNDAGYQFYVGATLGNNGKMTVTPETGIKLSKTMAAGVADPGLAFVFDLVNTIDTADGSTYPAWLVKANGTTVDTSVFFENGRASVELNAGDVLYIGGMTADDTFRIAERETATYLATATGLSQAGTVTVNRNEILPVSFVNDERGTGNLTIAKEVEHDFGQDYQIPADKSFTMLVTLRGIGTENAEFKAEHSGNSEIQSIETVNGQFTVTLKHDEQLEVFGLPAGTTATVVEQNPAAGFTPAYWDNGVPGDGRVTVQNNNTVSVIVVNDYEAEEVNPINITVSGNKTLNGRPSNEWLATDSFTFELQRYDGINAVTGEAVWTRLGDPATATDANRSFAFANAFENESYSSAGTYYYRVVEIEPLDPIPGVSYDKTVHSFSVIVGDADMDGRLEITGVVASRPDTTEVTATATGWNVNAEFTNTYSATGNTTVTIDLNKTITNNGGSAKSPAGYTFGLYDGEDLVYTSPVTTDRGFARFVLSYTKTGTYSYTLKEIVPGSVPAGWTYSTLEIPVTVFVSDDGDGTISAIIYVGTERPANAGTSITATFTNTYDPDDAELTVDFVNKELSGRDLVDGEFTFEIHSVDPQTMQTVKVMEGKNKADGSVVFDNLLTTDKKAPLTFDKVGTYYYWIMETSSDGKGVVTDKTTYRIIITVTDRDGALSASYTLVNATGNTITFKNTYTAVSVDHVIKAAKILRGRTLINDEFTFVLTELTANGASIRDPRSWTAKNGNDGKIAFPAITYDKAGTYEYRVEEVIPEGGTAFGISYDTTQYKVTVVVKDREEGTLYIESESVSLLNGGAANAVSFLNEYEANPTWAQFVGNKQLTGKVNNALQGGEFEFELYEADENWKRGSRKEIVENGAGGIITFTKIDFNTDEDQYFLVMEKNGGKIIDGITYDDTVYRVRVEVTDDLKGQLHATVHIYDGEGVPRDKISFVNVYEATGNDTVTLSGEKSLNGRDWKNDDSFTFELYEADENYDAAETPKMSTHADPITHRYSLSLDYTAEDIGKTYYYVLTEKNGGQTINGVTYSDAEYQIKVVVEDNGKGGVKTTVTVVNATTSTLNFVNEYHAANANVTIIGNKDLKGRDLVDREFKFLMIEADETFTALEGAIAQVALNENGRFTFDTLTFTEEGTYYFIINEDASVTADRVTFDDTVYLVTIDVTDDENGKLIASDPVIEKKGSNDPVNVISFTNLFVPQPTDINVDINVIKTIVNKSAETIGPENFEFLLLNLADNVDGDTVKSDRDGKAKFTLTFTEDDIGSTYHYQLTERNDGRYGVTYSTASYTITVTITLDEETNTLVATLTSNGTAVTELIGEFENVYDVDVFDNPDTGDSSHLALWIALMLISGGAALTLRVTDKKKRRQANA